MLDGRHTGTGGGNHMVLGGPTPADSPLLRRPDLLRSLLGYWHNHPSLSFLFSGSVLRSDQSASARRRGAERFAARARDRVRAGATRRARRRRGWSIACFAICSSICTGNTHRAEFCIDKLYAPDTSSGRQGLVELRSFEMPPHAQMSLAQQLLLRAARRPLLESPYNQTLVRWDTELHDRFMLPHFVADDFHDVLADLDDAAATPLQPEWFAPHIEFRFPVHGSITQRGVHVELRQALEPWYVLGEEPGAGGAVRYVDSSVERLQVKVTGHDRIAALPRLQRPRRCRFIRREPPASSSPASAIVPGSRRAACTRRSRCHAPLVFDLVDAMERSARLADARITSRIPVGATSRRFPSTPTRRKAAGSRGSQSIGHTPGSMTVPARGAPSGLAPLTLDLRRPPAPSAAAPTRARIAMSSITNGKLPIRSRAPVAVSRGVPADRRRVRRDARRHPARCARTARRSCSSLEAMGPHEFAVATRQRAPRDSRERRHLQRLRRSAGHRSALGAGHGAAARLGGRVEPTRSRD